MHDILLADLLEREEVRDESETGVLKDQREFSECAESAHGLVVLQE